MTEDHDAVMAAAAHVVTCFGGHRTEDYFACFAPDASFIFHPTPGVLRSRRAYEREWATWERDDGFQVVSCESSEGDVLMLGPTTAVFTHRVKTVVRSNAGEDTLRERESIVFGKVGDRWLGMHEHLSPDPADA